MPVNIWRTYHAATLRHQRRRARCRVALPIGSGRSFRELAAGAGTQRTELVGTASATVSGMPMRSAKQNKRRPRFSCRCPHNFDQALGSCAGGRPAHPPHGVSMRCACACGRAACLLCQSCRRDHSPPNRFSVQVAAIGGVSNECANVCPKFNISRRPDSFSSRLTTWALA